MPRSVTITSTVSPGVVIVVTLFLIEGTPPRNEGQTTIESAAPAAASWCPPDAPRSTPSLPVSTLTLKSVSTSSAASTTQSRLLTTAPALKGFAYHDASISMWFGLESIDFVTTASKDCTSKTVRKSPLSCIDAM